MLASRLRPWTTRLQRFALSAGPTLIYGALGVARNKWLAQTLSPGGLGILAQVLSAMGWLGQAAGLGLGLPLTRSVAAAHALDDPARERGAVRTAFGLALGAAGVVAICVIAAAPWISTGLLGSAAYAPLIRIASIGMVGLALAGTLLALFAGRGDLRAPLTLASAGAVTATALTFLLVPRHGLGGATLAAAALFPAGCAAALLAHGRRYRTALAWRGEASPGGERAGAMARVGVTGLALGLLDLGALIALRAHYVQAHGAEANGLLQAALALSQLVGSLFYTYLASYAFGALSARVAAAGSGAAEAARAYTRRQGPPIFLLTAMLLGAAMIGAAPLLHVLYSDRFDPARPLMAWTLLGEYARVATQVWMLAALPIGGMRLLAPIAIATPVALVAAYAALSSLGMETLSLPRAYAAANTVGLVVAAAVMGRRGVTLGRREIAALAVGAAALLALARHALAGAG